MNLRGVLTVRKMMGLAFLLAFVWQLSVTTLNVEAKYVSEKSNTITLNVRKPHYTVIFDANSGDGSMPSQNFVYGTAQALSKNLFTKTDNAFVGWNTEADGSGSSYDDEQEVSTLVAEDGGEITLYAQWDVYAYYNPGPVTFTTEMDTCIDTGIKLYSEANIDKDFEVAFDIAPGYTFTAEATIMNALHEESPYRGVLFRLTGRNDGNYYYIAEGGNKGNLRITGAGDHVVMRRTGGSVTLEYNGVEYILAANPPANQQHDTPTTFGCSMMANGDFWRPYQGTLSNMSIRLKEGSSYTINYDANSGTGEMASQVVRTGRIFNLAPNTFVRRGYEFTGWNTSADGSGVSYTNEQQVRSIASGGEEVTLYAMWTEAQPYTIIFDANGGTGTMDNQQMLPDDIGVNLRANTFTNEGLVFGKWNTQQDGSGDSYLDGQSVKNLAGSGGEITLYAIWAEQAYTHTAQRTFTKPASGFDYDDVGMRLFSAENINKDFEIRFDIDESISSAGQATILTAMDESGSPWPGIVFRLANSGGNFEIVATGDSKKVTRTFKIGSVKSVVIKRIKNGENQEIHICVNNGTCTKVNDINISEPFDARTAFGVSLNGSDNPQRQFVGTLSNMSVILYP